MTLPFLFSTHAYPPWGRRWCPATPTCHRARHASASLLSTASVTCACVRVCMCLCARAGVPVRVPVCTRACACVRVPVCACLCARACAIGSASWTAHTATTVWTGGQQPPPPRCVPPSSGPATLPRCGHLRQAKEGGKGMLLRVGGPWIEGGHTLNSQTRPFTIPPGSFLNVRMRSYQGKGSPLSCQGHVSHTHTHTQRPDTTYIHTRERAIAPHPQTLGTFPPHVFCTCSLVMTIAVSWGASTCNDPRPSAAKPRASSASSSSCSDACSE